MVSGRQVGQCQRFGGGFGKTRPGSIVNSPRIIKHFGVGVRFKAIGRSEDDVSGCIIAAHDLRGGQPDGCTWLGLARSVAHCSALLPEPNIPIGLVDDVRDGAIQGRLPEPKRRFVFFRIKVEFFSDRKVRAISSARGPHKSRSILAFERFPVLTIEGHQMGATECVFHKKASRPLT